MGYYVISNGEGYEVHTSWPKAQKALKEGNASSCRSFRFKEDAVRFVEGLRFAAPAAEGESIVFVDGAVDHGVRGFGASYFGRDDPRNGVWALEEPPFTSPRAELLAALRGAELASGPSVLLSDCEFVCRAYRERFPSCWANQDLMRRLAIACEASGSRIRRVPGHSGDPGNDAAHDLCHTALRLAKENPC
jgi:ribonuclease HI